MREIKFRVWESRTKIMFFPTSIPNPTQSNEETIFMQFTGLLDKNGKEIYGGDILSDGGNGYYGVREVFYSKGGYNIKYISGGRGCHHSQRLPFRYKDFEIIGNIYENGDLLR
jgi:uncharacterized phage protein (TIGR01671 family)